MLAHITSSLFALGSTLHRLDRRHGIGAKLDDLVPAARSGVPRAFWLAGTVS